MVDEEHSSGLDIILDGQYQVLLTRYLYCVICTHSCCHATLPVIPLSFCYSYHFTFHINSFSFLHLIVRSPSISWEWIAHSALSTDSSPCFMKLKLEEMMAIPRR